MRHTRLIAALLLIMAVVAVCASHRSHDTLLTVFRAAQAAAAVGMLLALPAKFLSDRLRSYPSRAVCANLHSSPHFMAAIPIAVLLC
jgi:hypothetical protein